MRVNHVMAPDCRMIVNLGGLSAAGVASEGDTMNWGLLGFLAFMSVLGLLGGSLLTALNADVAGTESVGELLFSGLWAVGFCFWLIGLAALLAIPLLVGYALVRGLVRLGRS